MQNVFTSYGRPCQLWVEHAASVRTPVDVCADVCVPTCADVCVQSALTGVEELLRTFGQEGLCHLIVVDSLVCTW